MGAKASSEIFPKKWSDLFSDPDQFFLKGKEILLEKDYPPPLRFALWLEYFLILGREPLKELWARLSMEEKKVLGIEILKCYMFQPLFIRISPEKKSITPTHPPLLKKQGKLLIAERGTGRDQEAWFYYPLVHHQFWPGLLTLLQDGNFSFEEAFKDLEPELIIADSFGMETIRQRVETLRSLFRKGPDGDDSFSMVPDQQNQIETSQAFMVEEAPLQDPETVLFSEGNMSAQSPSTMPDISPAKPATPKKRKKKKPAADQMALFD